MARQQKFADPIVGNEMVRAPRRASQRSAPPSTLFGRTCVVLLAAPWLFVMLEAVLQPEPVSSWSLHSLFFWVALTLFTLASIAVASYLTRRARRYEGTCDSERLLFSNARDAMLLVRVLRNPEDQPLPFSFIIKAENPAAIERLGSFGQETTYVNRNIDDVFPYWLKEKVQHEYTACVLSHQIRRYEISPPGGALTHESIATPVFDVTSEHVTHIIVIMRDVAERIQHERKLADALQRAEAANKSKSQFLASMSHELRTPLNAVLGYSEMLSLGIGGILSENHKQYAQFIHQSGSHLLKIIGDILDLSKIEAGQFVLHDEETPISPLIEACIVMIGERAVGKRLLLKTEIPLGLPVLSVDPLRLKQVVLNLLSNAIKFTDDGTITIKARFDKTKGLVITVSDTGMGMTEEEIAVAMEPFGQVESAFARNHAGTGLGLPIARHLVELHGGHLSVASRKRFGTTVSLNIPPERLVRERKNEQLHHG